MLLDSRLVSLSRLQSHTARALVVLGMIGFHLAMPAPAGAATTNDCKAGGGEVVVDFLSLSPASNITLALGDAGVYSTQLTVRVFCRDQNNVDRGEIPNSEVTFCINTPNATVNGTPVNCRINSSGAISGPTLPIELSLPVGQGVLTLASSDPGLAAGVVSARVGNATFFVSDAYSIPIAFEDSPFIDDKIWAQTPELGSLVLFGSGAAGMAGYALLRARGIRVRRKPSA